MSGDDRAPLTAAQLAQWAPSGVAAVLAGLDPAGDPDAGPLEWIAPIARPASAADGPVAERCAAVWEPDAPAQTIAGPLRLVVRGDVLPQEIVPALLAAPGVGSALIPVARVPGALRRRPWSWPLRIGVADYGLLAALEDARASGVVPAGLVEVRDVRVIPGAVDVLVLAVGLADAAAFVAEKRQVANLVLCATETSASWPLVDAQLALIRAASAAVITGVVPLAPDAQLAGRLLVAARFLSHAHPVDVAVTAAFERDILLVGEPEAIVDVTLPDILRTRARGAHLDLEAFDRRVAPPPSAAEPPASGATRGFDLDVVAPLVDELGSLAEASFDHESGAASAAVDVQSQIDEVLDGAMSDVRRVLQAYVGAPDAAEPDGLIHARRTAVDVFVGPPEVRSLKASGIPDDLLFDDPAAAKARLTVIFAPLVPVGPPQRAEVDVPRVGRSPNARFDWDVPEKGTVQARIIVLHRNRVLQTARLGGKVGAKATITDRIILWNDTGSLDERQPFDRSFVLNHARAKPRSVSVADGKAVIDDLKELESANALLRALLMRATQITTTGKSAAKAVRSILIDTAVAGHQLYKALASRLEGFESVRRVQIVSAEEADFLPLELVYDRLPPDPDATICAHWTAGETCGAHCFADAADTSVMCPAVFWGMSRVIERQRVPERGPTDDEKPRPDFVVLANPRGSRERLETARAVVAASSRVDEKDVDRTVDAVAASAPITTWDEWKKEMMASPADVLILMPHTDPRLQTMEISGGALGKGSLNPPYVTGTPTVEEATRHPIAVLFGCDTVGSAEDPAGWVGTFMQSGAAAVFSTMTMLIGPHAAAMSQRLVALLRDPAREGKPLGELVADFRREGVRSGLVAALAVTAYGDAGWRV